MDPSVRELERVARQAPSADTWAALARAEARVALPWRAYTTTCRALQLDAGAAVRDLLPAPTELRSMAVRWSGLRNLGMWWSVPTGSVIRQVVDAGHGYVFALCDEHQVAVDLFAQRWHVRRTGRRLAAQASARGHVVLTEWADGTSASAGVQLVRLDAATGDEVWRHRLDLETGSSGGHHGVVDAWTTAGRWAHVAFRLASGSVIVARIDMDEEDAGPVLLPFPSRDRWTSRATSEDGTFLAAINAGRELVRLGPELDHRWTHSGSGSETLLPLGLAAGGWLCLATPLDARDQSRRRSRHGADEVAIVDLVRFDDADGREVERRPLARAPRWREGEYGPYHWILPGPVALNDAVVVLLFRVDHQEGLLAFDASTLAPMWETRFNFRDQVRLSATADAVHVFEASVRESHMHALGAFDGRSSRRDSEQTKKLVSRIEPWEVPPLLTAGCVTFAGNHSGNQQLIVYPDAGED